MKIVKLVLHKYKRFFLNNIETLTYTPESDIQIILGTNGSGKSSLLSMLNPLPADIKKDFDTDGYKLIIIKHNEKEYVLSSGYVHASKHSFIVNNVEYNPGGTRTVQLELVHEHFNINPYSNSIILGANRLTNMSGTERKKLFTEISNVDYTFALSVFNKLKQRHRDIVGSIKILNESLIKTEASVLNNDQLEKNRTDIKYLKQLIEHLTSIYNHNIDNSVNIDSLISELNTLVKNYNLHIETYGILELDLSKLEKNKIVAETILTTIQTEIATLKDRIKNTLTSVTELNVTDIDTEINTQLDAMSKLEKSLYIDIDLNNIDVINEVYMQNISTLLDMLSDLKQYTEVNCKVDEITKLQSSIDALSIELHKNSERLTYYSNRKKELESLKNDTNKISCHNCGTTWYHNYSDDEYVNVTNTINATNDKILKITSELDILNSDMKLKKEKLDIINSIKTVTISTPELKNIWKYVFDKYNIHSENIQGIISELTTIVSYLPEWLKYTTYKNKVTELNTIKEKQVLVNTTNKNNVLTTVDELEETLSNKILELSSKQKEQSDISKQIANTSKALEIMNSIKTLLLTINTVKKSYVGRERNKALIGLVNELKLILTDIELSVTTNEQLLSKINSVKKEVAELSEMEKVLKLMVKELSPTEGLIAKSINSFLNVFLADMNSIINSIWSYNMEILPFDFNVSDDLDYKFPVLVSRSETIEDVSKLSSSMMEIIDLAFRIIYAKYANVGHFPLILDEFGRTFDQQHRKLAYEIIEQLLSTNFPQIYIVSHFEESYLRFSHGDITVLNTANIDMSNINRYNTVLKIS